MIADFSPFPRLTTRQLVLRELDVADAPLIHELRADEVTSALIGRELSKGIEDALAFIDRIKSGIGRNECIYWVICFEDTSDLIGTIGCWNFDPAAETAEIGYELLADFRGRGIMSEVLPRIVRFGFEQMHLKSILAFCSEQNFSSIRLLKKYRFKLFTTGTDGTRQQGDGMLSFVLTSTSFSVQTDKNPEAV